MYKKKFSLYIILTSFFLSILVSEYSLKHFDKNISTKNGKNYHQMIKTDAYRYLKNGYDTKEEWKDGIFFFKSGPEHYTKYLPSRIASLYYYIFDYKFFDEDENGQTKIKIGIHNFYLYFQCFFYFLSVFFFSNSLFARVNNNLIIGLAPMKIT